MKIHLNNIEYQLPSSWSQVPSARVMGLLRLAHELPCTERTKLAALQLVNPIPPKLFRKLVPWQVNELVQTLQWVWEQPIEGRPFECFEHGGMVYYTHPAHFRTTTFSEYLTAVVYLFQAYYDADTPRELSAARLMATLCRPATESVNELHPNYPGDAREPFNEHVVEARAKLFKDLPVGIIAAVVQYFVAELGWLYDHYDVFDDPPPKRDTVTNEELDFDWQSCLMEMKNLRYVVAEERIFGTVSEVMKAPVNDVFDALERLKTKNTGHRPQSQPVQTQQEYEDD